MIKSRAKTLEIRIMQIFSNISTALILFAASPLLNNCITLFYTISIIEYLLRQWIQ